MKKAGSASTFWYRNELSIVLIMPMLLFWAGQCVTGWKVHNQTRQEQHAAKLGLGRYLTSGHFLSATFENWESEFLQMGMYVLLTVWLRQMGSAESKKLKGEEGAATENEDGLATPDPDSPWPVRKGGWWLKWYSYSLCLAFLLLLLLSFALHLRGSIADYNEQQQRKGLPVESVAGYLGSADFWFESFQNWQSEFLAVASIVLLSIWLRQKGSPQSKPLQAPHHQTGS